MDININELHDSTTSLLAPNLQSIQMNNNNNQASSQKQEKSAYGVSAAALPPPLSLARIATASQFLFLLPRDPPRR